MTIPLPVDPRNLAAAMGRGSHSRESRYRTSDRIAVDSVTPGPVHDHIGCIYAGMGLRSKTALAMAARTRGMTTPHDEALARARVRLAAAWSPEGEEESDRERRKSVAAGPDTHQLQESVAAARGRLLARRDAGLDTAAAAEQLAKAISALSEAETVAVANEEQLERIQATRRERRDDCERRFELEDRVANLERSARSVLVDQLRGQFANAVRATAKCEPYDTSTDADPYQLTDAIDPATLPPTDAIDPATLPSTDVIDPANLPPTDAIEPAGDSTRPKDDPFAAEAVIQALAIGRLATVRAPLVVQRGLFTHASAAASWLRAPVIRV